MKQDQLTVLSFDRPTFPRVAISFDDAKKHKLTYGWYQTDGHTAAITTSQVSQDSCQTLLDDASLRERYTWGSMLFSLEKNILIQRFNQRDWLLSINLHDTQKPVNQAMFCPKAPSAINLKNSQKIYANWLMNQLALRKVDRLNQIAWAEIYELASKIDEDNPCTMMLTDGEDSVFYQGSQFSNAFYYTRSCPPHDKNGLLKTGSLEFQIDAIDLNHSLVVISTTPIAHPNSTFFNLKQMLVVRGSEIVWNNDPNMSWEQGIAQSPEEPAATQNYLHKVKLRIYRTNQKREKRILLLRFLLRVWIRNPIFIPSPIKQYTNMTQPFIRVNIWSGCNPCMI